MRNPLRRVKHRLGRAIQSRVDHSVEMRTAALMTTVHGLSIQLSELASTMADWRLEIERSVARVARALDTVSRGPDLDSAELEKLRSEWAETLSELRAVLGKIDGATEPRRS